MKVINILTKILKKFIEKNSYYLELDSVKQKNGVIYCEFRDLLSIDGNLIKIDIKEIYRNRNILRSISPETLFIIGSIYNKYQTVLNKFRIKTIDVTNRSVILENPEEKINIKIKELLHGDILIQQINSLDLIRMLYPYAYEEGFKTNLTTSSSQIEETSELKVSNIINIANLF